MTTPATKTSTTTGAEDRGSPSGASPNVMFWRDVSKSLIGTVAGAGIAYASNWVYQRRVERRKNLAAARGAAFTLRAVFAEFLLYRATMRHSMSARYALTEAMLFAGQMPEWAVAQPIAHEFSLTSIFAFESLTFLLDSQLGQNAYEQLQLVEQTYVALARLQKLLNESSVEAQKALASFHQRKQGRWSWEEAEIHLGLELPARLRDAQRSIILHLENDETRIVQAVEALDSAVRSEFGQKFKLGTLQVSPKLVLDALPPYPPMIAEYAEWSAKNRLDV